MCRLTIITNATQDHEFVSIETSSATKSIASDSITRAVDYKRVKAPLLNELIDFIKSTLGPARVNEVRASDKMVLAPLVVVDHMVCACQESQYISIPYFCFGLLLFFFLSLCRNVAC